MQAALAKFCASVTPRSRSRAQSVGRRIANDSHGRHRVTAYARRHWACALFTAAMIAAPGERVYGQALEPRSYTNTPVGINFLLLGYGHTDGDIGFDASSPIQDAKFHVDAGFAAYARSLDVWGLSGKVLAVVPFAEASGSATAAGQSKERQVFGLADPILRASVNFFVASSLTLEDFPFYF